MRRRGFTITELLVVIVIISILAGLILPAIWTAFVKAKETQCINNLQQLHKGMMIYRDDYMSGGREVNPMRATHLFSLNYVQNKECFLCPFDDSSGADGGKPDGTDPDGKEVTQFAELDEPIADPPGVVDGVAPCSYMYECAMGARSFDGWDTLLTLPARAATVGKAKFIDLDGDWTSANATKWGEVKAAQMRYGDTFLNPGLDPSRWHGYSPTKFPVLRCFWHTNNPNTKDDGAIINLAYTGNLFRSEAHWETASKPW